MNLVKHDTSKVHAFKDGRPLCGGGHNAKSVRWQNDFGPVNCDRCQEIQKTQTSMQTSMIEIEKAAKVYADKHEDLTRLVETLESEINALKRTAMADIKKAVAAAAEKKAALVALVEANPAHFKRPKSIIFYGIRVGFREGQGSVDWEDDAAVVALVKQHFPERLKDLVKVTEEPRAKALKQMTAAELQLLGVEAEPGTNAAFVESTTSDVDKIVTALLAATEEKEAA